MKYINTSINKIYKNAFINSFHYLFFEEFRKFLAKIYFYAEILFSN